MRDWLAGLCRAYSSSLVLFLAGRVAFVLVVSVALFFLLWVGFSWSFLARIGVGVGYVLVILG